MERWAIDFIPIFILTKPISFNLNSSILVMTLNSISLILLALRGIIPSSPLAFLDQLLGVSTNKLINQKIHACFSRTQSTSSYRFCHSQYWPALLVKDLATPELRVEVKENPLPLGVPLPQPPRDFFAVEYSPVFGIFEILMHPW